MQCAEFESGLNDVLDRRLWLDAEPSLAEHVRRCDECRKLAASYETLVAGLEQIRLPQPSVELAARIASDVARIGRSPLDVDAASVHRASGGGEMVVPASVERRSSGFSGFAGGSRSRGVLAVAALAAAALLAVSLRWGVDSTENRGTAKQDGTGKPLGNADPRGSHGGSLANRHAPRQKPVVEGANSPAIQHAANGGMPPEKVAAAPEKIDPYRDLAEETSHSLAVAMQLLPGVGGSPKHGRGSAAREPTTDWVRGVADGLKPVTHPTAGAVHSFLELFAASDEGSRL